MPSHFERRLQRANSRQRPSSPSNAPKTYAKRRIDPHPAPDESRPISTLSGQALPLYDPSRVSDSSGLDDRTPSQPPRGKWNCDIASIRKTTGSCASSHTLCLCYQVKLKTPGADRVGHDILWDLPGRWDGARRGEMGSRDRARAVSTAKVGTYMSSAGPQYQHEFWFRSSSSSHSFVPFNLHLISSLGKQITLLPI